MNTTLTRRHALRAAGVASASLLGLAACGSGGTKAAATAKAGSGKGTINIWAHVGQDSENAALQGAVTAYNQSQTGVTAKLRLIPGDSYTTTLTATKVADLPDVMEFDGPTLANYVFNQKMEPLKQWVSPATISEALPGIIAQGTVNGTLYGLGMYDSGLGLYGNKKLLDAAGVTYPTTIAGAWTAAEFNKALAALAAKDADHKVIDLNSASGFSSEWGTYGFAPILWSAGGNLIADNKSEGVLNTAANAKALANFARWKQYTDPNADGNAFTKGRVALSWSGHWNYPTYSKALGADLVLMPLPDFGNGAKTGQGSWGWGLTAGSKNATAGGVFLDVLLDKKNITAMTAANGAPPGQTALLDASAVYKTGGPLNLFAQGLTDACSASKIASSCVAVTRPVTAGYPIVTSEFGKALSAIWNQADPMTSLTTAAKNIDINFADNNNYTIGS